MTTPVTNALDQLAYFPNLMNYKGNWNNAVQYFKNDIVVDSNNGASYILVGSTSLLDGGDPISNSAWFELMPHVTSVDGIAAGNGIGLTPPATNPTITNTGVRTLTATNGLGAATIGQVSQLFNLGLLGMIDGVGISSELSNGTLTILNDGLVGLVRVGFGNTGTSQNIQLTNLGVNSITGSANITVATSGGSNIISNTGVLGATLGGGIINSGGGQDLILSANPSGPLLGVLEVTGTMSPNPVLSTASPAPSGTGLIPTSLDPNSFLAFQLRNGSADPNPTWVFDLTGLWIEFDQAPPTGLGIPSVINVGLVDDVTAGGPFEYYKINGDNGRAGANVFQNFGQPSSQANLGRVIVRLADLQSASLRTISKLKIYNELGGGLANYFVRVVSYAPIQLHYFPNGLP